MSETRTGPPPVDVVTRRDVLKLGSGLVLLGAGLGVSLVAAPATAAAAKRYELRFFRTAGEKTMALDALVLPPDVVREIEAGNAGELEFVWHARRGDQRRKLAQHAAPGRGEVARKKRPARGR